MAAADSEVHAVEALGPFSALWESAPPTLRFLETQSLADLEQDVRALTKKIVSCPFNPAIQHGIEAVNNIIEDKFGDVAKDTDIEQTPPPWWVMWYSIVVHRIERTNNHAFFDRVLTAIVYAIPLQPVGTLPELSYEEIYILFKFISGGASYLARPGGMDVTLAVLRQKIQKFAFLAQDHEFADAVRPFFV